MPVATFLPYNDLKLGEEIMQETINVENNGLHFSSEKTIAVLFCRKRCYAQSLGLHLYDFSILKCESIKHLGLHFDEEMMRKTHIHSVP